MWVLAAVMPARIYPSISLAAVGSLDKDQRLEVYLATAELQASTRTALLQIGGVLTVISAAILAWNQFAAAQRKQREDNHLAVFGQAVDALSGSTVGVRVAGLHQLAILAEQSPEHRAACARAFAETVRAGAPWPPTESRPKAERFTSVEALRRQPLPPEVTAAFEFLSTLSSAYPGSVGRAAIGAADLRGSVLPRVVVQELDLAGCQLRHSDLTKASFIRCNLAGADFRDAVIRGARFVECGLAHADFGGAQYDTETAVVGGSYDRNTRWHVEGFTPAGAELLPDA
ncbi:pentapeptide repeat-containing protein [Cellulomonas sp. Leaf395]|uniref:pentapeptide repeat-containing protein n=1 Tax=Cellulomonas sp. Leaf395 TaxID=1736362 RepID=UPI0007017711|nr:pentapeptide repeat-containing protein [Cellulomonas sp. Leaf395]KQS98775.1 hypothetical protein ASG23_13610 [Cellulomonas sp. Leaf395]